MTKFDFNEDYILENEFVRLEPLKETHYDFLLEYTLNEPEIWEYSMVKCDTPENLIKYINIAIQKRIDKKEYTFVVFDKQKQKYVGATRYCDVFLSSNRLQMGYTWYGKKHQGSGVNKHCKWLLLNFAFEDMQMYRVEFRAYTENLRSINALLSIGCEIDGVLRSNAICPKTGTRRDTMVLSILKNEWFDSVKMMLWNKIQNPIL